MMNLTWFLTALVIPASSAGAEDPGEALFREISERIEQKESAAAPDEVVPEAPTAPEPIDEGMSESDQARLFRELDALAGREPAPPAPAPAAAPAEAPIDPEAAEEIRRFVEIARKKAVEREAHRRQIQEALTARQSEPPPVEEETCAGNRAQCRRFVIGLGAHGAAGPTRDHSLEGIGLGGFSVALTLGSFMTIGLNQIGGGAAPILDGTRLALNAAPYAEVFFFPRDFLQAYIQTGLVLQRRFGAELPHTSGGAAYAGVGLRFWMGSRFTLSPTIRLYGVGEGEFLMSGRILPEGAAVLTAGLTTELHF